MTDRQTLALVTALLRVGDVVTAEIAHGRPLPFGDLVADARDLMAAVDRALVPTNGVPPVSAMRLDRMVLHPEQLDAMLDEAVLAYEASVAHTLDHAHMLTRDDRVAAMRAALAAALWGFPP